MTLNKPAKDSAGLCRPLEAFEASAGIPANLSKPLPKSALKGHM